MEKTKSKRSPELHSDSDEENDSPPNPRNLIVSDTYDDQIEHVQPEQSQPQRRSERLSSRSTTQSSHYDTARSSGSVQKRRSTPTLEEQGRTNFK